MQITGRNLELIRDALTMAQSDIHNQIATCPDVFEYAEDIEELEKLKTQFQRLLTRVEKALNS